MKYVKPLQSDADTALYSKFCLAVKEMVQKSFLQNNRRLKNCTYT